MRTAAMLVPALVLACDASPKPAASAKAEPATKAAAVKPAAKPAEPEPKPDPLPPAPEGTVIIDGAYVHTCAEPKACPQLLQDAGAAHCEGLTLGSLKWTLPTIEQLESWKGNDALAGYDVFHWSGSRWATDEKQLWIYDPGSGSKTTAKPDRKPFTIRCVAKPPAS